MGDTLRDFATAVLIICDSLRLCRLGSCTLCTLSTPSTRHRRRLRAKLRRLMRRFFSTAVGTASSTGLSLSRSVLSLSRGGICVCDETQDLVETNRRLTHGQYFPRHFCVPLEVTLILHHNVTFQGNCHLALPEVQYSTCYSWTR